MLEFRSERWLRVQLCRVESDLETCKNHYFILPLPCDGTKADEEVIFLHLFPPRHNICLEQMESYVQLVKAHGWSLEVTMLDGEVRRWR